MRQKTILMIILAIMLLIGSTFLVGCDIPEEEQQFGFMSQELSAEQVEMTADFIRTPDVNLLI